jgi:chemotaxis protein histidine kinase CheA
MKALEERTKELRQQYARTLPRFVAEIGRMMVVKVPRADLLHQFHSLAGSAGTFGYEEIATLAWEAEHILSSNSAPEITPGELGRLTSRMVHLTEVLSRTLEVVDESPNATWSTFEGGGVV